MKQRDNKAFKKERLQSQFFLFFLKLSSTGSSSTWGFHPWGWKTSSCELWHSFLPRHHLTNTFPASLSRYQWSDEHEASNWCEGWRLTCVFTSWWTTMCRCVELNCVQSYSAVLYSSFYYWMFSTSDKTDPTSSSLCPLKGCWLARPYSNWLKTIQIGAFQLRLRQPQSSAVYNLKMMERTEGERHSAPPRQSAVTGICLDIKRQEWDAFLKSPLEKAISEERRGGFSINPLSKNDDSATNAPLLTVTIHFSHPLLKKRCLIWKSEERPLSFIYPFALIDGQQLVVYVFIRPLNQNSIWQKRTRQ